MIISRDILQSLILIVEKTMNSPFYPMSVKNREGYLNSSWQLIKEYERKVIAQENE